MGHSQSRRRSGLVLTHFYTITNTHAHRLKYTGAEMTLGVNEVKNVDCVADGNFHHTDKQSGFPE